MNQNESLVVRNEIEKMCSKVSQIRVDDLPEFLVTKLKRFLVDISGEGGKGFNA